MLKFYSVVDYIDKTESYRFYDIDYYCRSLNIACPCNVHYAYARSIKKYTYPYIFQMLCMLMTALIKTNPVNFWHAQSLPFPICPPQDMHTFFLGDLRIL